MKVASLLLVATLGSLDGASAETLVCLSDRLSVEPAGDVNVTALLASGATGSFDWTADAGRFETTPVGTVWHSANVAAGRHVLRVAATGSGVPRTCELSVVVTQGVLSVGGVRRYFLLHNEKEPEGFASYSYILLGTMVSAPRKAAVREVVRAFLTSLRSLEDVKAVSTKEQFNLTLLPVVEEPPSAVVDEPAGDFAVDWVLDHYDYDRALQLLESNSVAIRDQLGGDYWTGPYIVSRRKDVVVVHDLTNARPSLAERWVKLHVNQVTQQGDWSRRGADQFVLNIMTVMNTWAEGVAKTKDVVSGWIVWIES